MERFFSLAHCVWSLRPSCHRYQFLLLLLHLVLCLRLVAWFTNSVMISICTDRKYEQHSSLLDWLILLGVGRYYGPLSNPIITEDFILQNICCPYSVAEGRNPRVQQLFILPVTRQVALISCRARRSVQPCVYLQSCNAGRLWILKNPLEIWSKVSH